MRKTIILLTIVFISMACINTSDRLGKEITYRAGNIIYAYNGWYYEKFTLTKINKNKVTIHYFYSDGFANENLNVEIKAVKNKTYIIRDLLFKVINFSDETITIIMLDY